MARARRRIMRRRVFLLLALFVLSSRTLADETHCPRWIVVTAPAFRSAVEPLCAHRKLQGFDVAVLESTDVLTPADIDTGKADKLRHRVTQLCREAKGPAYVLLLGAIE